MTPTKPKTAPKPKASEAPENAQPGVDLTPGGNLSAEYAAASEDERRIDFSPANTPGGASARPITPVTDAQSKQIDKGEVVIEEPVLGFDGGQVTPKKGDTVLYRVSPLDPAVIKNEPKVEDADLLPATVMFVNDLTCDLDIHLPSGRSVLNKHVTFGAGSGQWRWGPKHAAVTEDSAPDADHRTSFVGQEAVKENEDPERVS